MHDVSVPVQTCERCGAALTLGEFPFCPHGRSQLQTHPDDVPGGFWAENGFDQPTWFPSHSAHERALAQNGFEIRAKNAGPDDKICRRWDTVDLEGAAVLVSRGAEARASRRASQVAEVRAAQAAFPITVTPLQDHEVGQ